MCEYVYVLHTAISCVNSSTAPSEPHSWQPTRSVYPNFPETTFPLKTPQKSGLVLFRLTLPSLILGIKLLYASEIFTVSLSFLISWNSFATALIGALSYFCGGPCLGPALSKVLEQWLELRWASCWDEIPLMDGPVARASICSQPLLSPDNPYILVEVAREGRGDVIVRHLSWQAKMLTFIQRLEGPMWESLV